VSGKKDQPAGGNSPSHKNDKQTGSVTRTINRRDTTMFSPVGPAPSKKPGETGQGGGQTDSGKKSAK